MMAIPSALLMVSFKQGTFRRSKSTSIVCAHSGDTMCAITGTSFSSSAAMVAILANYKWQHDQEHSEQRLSTNTDCPSDCLCGQQVSDKSHKTDSECQSRPGQESQDSDRFIDHGPVLQRSLSLNQSYAVDTSHIV